METIQVKNLTDVVINTKRAKSMYMDGQNIWNKTYPKIEVTFAYDDVLGSSSELVIFIKRVGLFNMYGFNKNGGTVNTFIENEIEGGTNYVTPSLGANVNNVKIFQRSEQATIYEMVLSGNARPFDHIDLGDLPDLTKLVFGSLVGKAKTFSLGKNKLTEIDQKFANNTNLELAVVDMGNIESMTATFENCTNLNTTILHHTSKIKSMNRVFNGCTKLLKIPDIDTSSLSTMDTMFQNCHIISDSFTIRNNITSYASAFTGCATAEGASLVLNYSDEKFLPLVQKMVATADGNVTVGTLVP